jgi:hypothetical protein
MGRFKRGTHRPADSGRKKGTPNKKTLFLKDTLESLDCDVPTKIVELLPQLSLEKQADILIELMKYLFPVRKAVEHTGPEGGPIAFEHQRNYILRVLAEPDLMEAAQSIAERMAVETDQET